MAENKDYHDIFEKPTKTPRKHPLLLGTFTIIGLSLLGLLFPVIGLPYSVVMIDNQTKYGKLLLAFSLVGAMVWTGFMVYGWMINRMPLSPTFWK